MEIRENYHFQRLADLPVTFLSRSGEEATAERLKTH